MSLADPARSGRPAPDPILDTADLGDSAWRVPEAWLDEPGDWYEPPHIGRLRDAGVRGLDLLEQTGLTAGLAIRVVEAEADERDLRFRQGARLIDSTSTQLGPRR